MLHRLDIAIDRQQRLGIGQLDRSDGEPVCSDRESNQDQGAMGRKERISSVPGRTTPAADSGISFQAPGRSPSGSDTTSRVSSPKPCSISTSGCSCRNVATLVEKYS